MNMQYYKDVQDGIHAIPSDEFEKILPIGCIKITQEEVDFLRNQKLTTEDIRIKKIKPYEIAIQKLLDDIANQYRYDNIVTASSYAALPVGSPFQEEGMRFALWRAHCWDKAYGILSINPNISIEEVISQLPKLEEV